MEISGQAQDITHILKLTAKIRMGIGMGVKPNQKKAPQKAGKKERGI